MLLQRFDLNLLVVFDAIYTEANLTRAAARLHLTQPTVSNALARLRQAYGDPLFVRSGRGVTPTPRARQMAAPVRAALRQMQATLDGLVEFAPATSDRCFRISIGELAGAALLPPLVEILAREAPGVRLETYPMDRREIADALALGTLDLAIDIPQLSAARLERAPLAAADYVCALRRGHRYARGRLTIQRFVELEFIAVSSRRSGSSLAELALQRAGRRAAPLVRTPYYLPALRTVERTDLALLAPRALAGQFEVVAKELPIELDAPGSCLFWHRSAADDPANAWLRDSILRAGS
jgi:DNA-binding transcriptional LysR family regulator